MSRVTMRIGLAMLSLASARGQDFVESDVVVLRVFTGEAQGDQFGWVSDPVRDLDGDGVDDLLITAIGNDEGGGNAGKLYVYSGSSGSELFSYAGVAADGLGTDVGDAGDINGDGTPDVIVGAQARGSGRAYVISGSDGSLIRELVGELAGDRFGASVGSINDVNGDGVPELIVGATRRDFTASNAGRAYVISGADGTTLNTFDGAASSDNLGSAINGVGDVNGDGQDDYLVGAQGAGASNTGLAYVVSGATGAQIRVFTPGSPAAAFGQFFVATPGDVNADGVPDLYVSDYNVNRAYLYSGSTGALLKLFTGTGGFGIGRGAGDVNRDGVPDLILASWVHSAGASQAGRAELFSGKNFRKLRTITSATAGENFGFDAHGVADTNGDGLPDYFVTAATFDSSRGQAYLIAGNPAWPDGDVNCDLVVDSFDIAAFVLALTDAAAHAAAYPGCPAMNADVNFDGVIDAFDIAAFVALITG